MIKDEYFKHFHLYFGNDWLIDWYTIYQRWKILIHSFLGYQLLLNGVDWDTQGKLGHRVKMSLYKPGRAGRDISVPCPNSLQVSWFTQGRPGAKTVDSPTKLLWLPLCLLVLLTVCQSASLYAFLPCYLLFYLPYSLTGLPIFFLSPFSLLFPWIFTVRR